MDDLEAELRAEVTRRVQQFSPSSGMQQRIEARVWRRDRQRRLLAGAALTGAAGVLAVTAMLGDPTGNEGGSVMIDDDGRVQTADETTTTTAAGPLTEISEPEQNPTTSSSATTSSTTTSATTTTTSPPPEPPLSDLTPLSRHGIGPIRVGMTVAEAEAAAGVSIVVYNPYQDDPPCANAQVVGMDVWFELELPDASSSDPRAVGVIRTVSWNHTEEGAVIGHSVADLDRIYGPPTRTVEHFFGGDEVRIYESGGYAYAATIFEGRVRYLTSGDPDWQDTPEGCQLNR